jgi:two-component system, OmpR family, alkaline phosphatase synthesis response regulator PhoP
VARILIVDDEPEIVRFVRRYLEEDGCSVAVAYDGEEALGVLRRDPPDLVVLDLCLPRRDGWELTRLIRNDRHLGSLPIIMLTARVEGTDKIVGLELGADDYITKPFNPREVVARVRALLRRSQNGYQTRTGCLRSGPLVLDLGQRSLLVHDRAVTLTPTEFSLCQLFMENVGYTFRRDELGNEVLRFSQTGSGRTLDSHIKNLRQKIELDPRHPQFIQTVHGIGYRLTKPEGKC